MHYWLTWLLEKVGRRWRIIFYPSIHLWVQPYLYKKGLSRKMNFFLWLIDHEIEKELEKNLRMAFIDGFFSISPKIISLRRNKTHENALYKPCVFTKDKWCSMLPIFVLVSPFFTVFGRETARAIYLGPVLYIKLGI